MTVDFDDDSAEADDEAFGGARWFKTDPSLLIGRESQIPASLEQVASSEYRPILSQLFKEWLLSRREGGQIDIFAICLSILDSGAVPTSHKALDSVNTLVRPGEDAIIFSEWEAEVTSVERSWALFRDDLIALLSTYKGKRKDLQAATALNLFVALEEHDDDIVEAARKVANLTTATVQNMEDGVSALVTLQQFLSKEGVLKIEYDTGSTFRNLVSLVGIARDDLVRECAEYQRLGQSRSAEQDKPTRRTRIIEALNQYNNAVLTLADTITSLARVLEAGIAEGAETIARKNFTDSNPQVAAGLFLLQGGGLMLATGLGAAGIIFPPLGIAAGAIGVAAFATQKLATAYHSRKPADPEKIRAIVAEKLNRSKGNHKAMSKILSTAEEGFTTFDTASLAAETADSFGLAIPAAGDTGGVVGPLVGSLIVPFSSVIGGYNFLREAEKLSEQTQGSGSGEDILTKVSRLARGESTTDPTVEEKRVSPSFQDIVRKGHLEGDVTTLEGQMASLDSLAVYAIQEKDFTHVKRMLEVGVITNIRLEIRDRISQGRQQELLESLSRIEAVLQELVSKGVHAEIKSTSTGLPTAGDR